ncbi:hypothetical protein DFJ73DRAFT_772463 [Zopfochytrium polystomum]|nr:hypothetical protein DFJ73DRAFT_772463 [Zopfochytrium polystomum]
MAKPANAAAAAADGSSKPPKKVKKEPQPAAAAAAAAASSSSSSSSTSNGKSHSSAQIAAGATAKPKKPAAAAGATTPVVVVDPPTAPAAPVAPTTLTHYRVVTARLFVHLPPIFAGNVWKGIHELLSRLLMKYMPELDGVLVAYSDVRIEEQAAKIINDSPYFHFHLRVTFTPFGTVNKVSKDHIGLLVNGTFNASIPADQIRKPEFAWRPALRVWRHASGLDSVVKPGVLIRFTVVDLPTINGMLTISGSLTTHPTDTGIVVVEDESTLTQRPEAAPPATQPAARQPPKFKRFIKNEAKTLRMLAAAEAAAAAAAHNGADAANGGGGGEGEGGEGGDGAAGDVDMDQPLRPAVVKTESGVAPKKKKKKKGEEAGTPKAVVVAEAAKIEAAVDDAPPATPVVAVKAAGKKRKAHAVEAEDGVAGAGEGGGGGGLSEGASVATPAAADDTKPRKKAKKSVA